MYNTNGITDCRELPDTSQQR